MLDRDHKKRESFKLVGFSYAREENRSAANRCMNLLTVDLEDWFHICDVEDLLPRTRWDSLPSTVVSDTEKLLELMHIGGCQATFFVLGYVAERHPHLISLIHGMGHEIAYHGWDHELVYNLEPHSFRQILRRGTQKIEDLIGRKIIGFRAPQWSINDRAPWALDVLAHEGFLYDSSRAPLRFIGSESYPRQPHRIATDHGPLWEFPPLTLKTPFGHYPAGGGWGLRCLPYPLLAQEVSRNNVREMPAVFFFHPREMNPGKSIVGLPPCKKFILNARIWSSRAQLIKLLSHFEFTSIERYLQRKSQEHAL